MSNKIHDSSPTLFSLTAVPVLEEIANHLDRRLGGIWMDQEGVIWAKLLPCGNVYIHAGAIKERIKGVDEYKRAYVAIYRSDEKKRLTSKRTDSPRACYRVPLQDIDMHYRPRANDGTHEADGVGS